MTKSSTDLVAAVENVLRDKEFSKHLQSFKTKPLNEQTNAELESMEDLLHALSLLSASLGKEFEHNASVFARLFASISYILKNR